MTNQVGEHNIQCIFSLGFIIYNTNSPSVSKDTTTRGSTLFIREPVTMKEFCGVDTSVYQLTRLESEKNKSWTRLFLEDGW